MSKSDKKKEYDAKWAKENLTVLGCSVTKSKAEKFRKACAEEGTNPNAVFRGVVDEMIARHTPEES